MKEKKHGQDLGNDANSLESLSESMKESARIRQKRNAILEERAWVTVPGNRNRVELGMADLA